MSIYLSIYSYAEMNNPIHQQMSVIVVEELHMYNSAWANFVTVVLFFSHFSH